MVLAMPMSPVTRPPAPLVAARRHLDADLDRPPRLSRRHRRPGGQVGGAGGDPRSRRSGRGSSGVCDADVDHDDARAPTSARSAFTTAPPARKFATICAVTSCGHGVTPGRARRGRPRRPPRPRVPAGRRAAPAIPASCAATSSRTPREPRGLVIRSSRSRAAARAPRRGADGGGGVGDDVGGGHPESRPQRAADGQRDLRLASAAGRRPMGTDARAGSGLTHARNRDPRDNGRPVGWAVRHREESPVSSTAVVLIIVVRWSSSYSGSWYPGVDARPSCKSTSGRSTSAASPRRAIAVAPKPSSPSGASAARSSTCAT